jgi:hypothetical protein
VHKAGSVQEVIRKGDYEWGYTSKHTSYLLDRTTGLKVITETDRNVVDAGKRQRVTVTLANTGTQPISLRAPKDCALQVMTVDGSAPKDASNFDPHEAADATHARSWTCAGSTADPDADGSIETILLVPGEERAAYSFIAVPDRRETSVFGLCRCSYAGAADPNDPVLQAPLSDLDHVVAPGAAPLIPYIAPTIGAPLGEESIDAFFTPPIGLGPA